MKIFNQEFLIDNVEMTWVNPGDDVSYAQGAALNRLNKEYPTKKTRMCGYFLYRPPVNPVIPEDDLPEGLYYIIDRKTKLDSGEIKDCLIAFKENGDSITGHAIFK